MSRTFARLIAAFGGMVLLSTLVFSAQLDLPLVDAIYFVVTTITTVGYGDYSLRAAPTPLKLYGILLMLAGSGFIGLFFGFVTDRLVGARLQDLFGERRRKMRGHVIVCGLGQLGFRIVTQLVRMGHAVVAIDRNEDGRFLDELRRLGVHVVLREVDSSEALELASLEHARALVVATEDDLVNLKVTARARSLHPAIHIVLRMFDQDFADKIEETFHVGKAFSSTALAAPSFAMAAVDPDHSIVGSFESGTDLFLSIRAPVSAGSRLAGLTPAALRDEHRLHPVRVEREGVDRHVETLRVGDHVTLVGDHAAVQAFFG